MVHIKKRTRNIIILLIVVFAIIITIVINNVKENKIAEKEDKLIQLRLEQAAMELSLDLDIYTDKRLSHVKDLNAFLMPTKKTDQILKRWEVVHKVDPEYPYPEKEIKERDWMAINHFLFGDLDDEEGGAKAEMIYDEQMNIDRAIHDYILYGDTDTDDPAVEEAERRMETNRAEASKKNAKSPTEEDDEIDENKRESNEEDKGDESYKTYVNDRFGFTVTYPSSFVADDMPDNNDGIKVDDDSAVIIASGSHAGIVAGDDVTFARNATSIKVYYDKSLSDIEAEGHTISYKRLEDDWYVISYLDGENIVYEKSMMNDDIIANLLIEYPADLQDDYNAVVERVSRSFRIE